MVIKTIIDKKIEIERKREKRLLNLQNLHRALLDNSDTSKFSRLDKVAYILWQKPNTRNSDRTHAIEYYKMFHSDLVSDSLITFENIYQLPKMYDLQRDRATIQNTERLFPAKESTLHHRIEKEMEYRTYYLESSPSGIVYDTDYYLYLDESGKNEKYFVLGGVLINSAQTKQSLENKLSEIQESLSNFRYVPSEWKFSQIKANNLSYYLNLLERLKQEKLGLVFVSAFVENSGLSQGSRRNRTRELLKLILHDCLSLTTGYMTKSSYSSVTSNLQATLDNDGDGLDILEQESFKVEMQEVINRENEYFSTLDNLEWQDSRSNLILQLSDLYASSLNNIFSEIPEETETARAKKVFAKAFLDFVGIKSIEETFKINKKNKVEFINRCINKE